MNLGRSWADHGLIKLVSGVIGPQRNTPEVMRLPASAEKLMNGASRDA